MKINVHNTHTVTPNYESYCTHHTHNTDTHLTMMVSVHTTHTLPPNNDDYCTLTHSRLTMKVTVHSHTHT